MFAEEMNDNVTLECCVQEVIFQRDGGESMYCSWAWHRFLTRMFFWMSQQSHLIKPIDVEKQVCCEVCRCQATALIECNLRSLKRFQTNVPWISLSRKYLLRCL